jgi:hypothetical protein
LVLSQVEFSGLFWFLFSLKNKNSFLNPSVREHPEELVNFLFYDLKSSFSVGVFLIPHSVLKRQKNLTLKTFLKIQAKKKEIKFWRIIVKFVSLFLLVFGVKC